MQIDESDEQVLNAPEPSTESFESASNVTLERLEHSKKQRSSIISTGDGMEIDDSDGQN
jgi:hypothetical protein